MEPKNVTLEVLKDIRQELRETRTELKAEIRETRTDLKAEIHETNARVDTLANRADALADRMVDSEIRVVTAVTDLHGTVRELVATLREQHDLRPRVDR
jgi:chromosome segregation ATPase